DLFLSWPAPPRLLLRSELLHHLVEAEARRLHPDRELLEGLQPPGHDRLRRHEEKDPMTLPVVVPVRLRTALERICSQIVKLRRAELVIIPLPDGDAMVILFDEGDLPVQNPDREQVAVVAPVEELLPRGFLYLALEERQEVVAVQVDFEGLGPQGAALHAAVDHGRIAASGGESRNEVLVRKELVEDGARLDHARPADQRRHAITALPVGGLFSPEWCAAAIGPRHHLRAIV